MKKKLINILTGLTKVILILSITATTLFFIIIAYQVFTKNTSQWKQDYAKIVVAHSYNASVEFDTKIFYRNGKVLDTRVKTSSISTPIILTESITTKIIFLALVLLLFGNTLFIIYQFYKVFAGLKHSLGQGTFFYSNIHKHIQRIAYSLLVFSGLMILNKIFFLLTIEKIKIMDQTLDTSITFGSDAVLNVFFGLVILLMAEVFKEGLKLKQESDLTI